MNKMKYTNQQAVKHFKKAHLALDMLKSEIECEMDRLGKKTVNSIETQARIEKDIQYFEDELCDILESMIMLDEFVKELE